MVDVILWIDDDPDAMDAFKAQLSDALPAMKIEFFDNVDDGLTFVRTMDAGMRVLLVIWDMMLAAGDEFARVDTRFGSRTGERLHDRLREYFHDIPFVLFTNITEPSVQAKYRNPPKENALRKDRLGVDEFSKTILRLLS